MSSDRASPETVMARYAELINRHDFSLLVPLIAPDATFWFSSDTRSVPSTRAQAPPPGLPLQEGEEKKGALPDRAANSLRPSPWPGGG